MQFPTWPNDSSDHLSCRQKVCVRPFVFWLFMQQDETAEFCARLASLALSLSGRGCDGGRERGREGGSLRSQRRMASWCFTRRGELSSLFLPSLTWRRAGGKNSNEHHLSSEECSFLSPRIMSNVLDWLTLGLPHHFVPSQFEVVLKANFMNLRSLS